MPAFEDLLAGWPFLVASAVGATILVVLLLAIYRGVTETPRDYKTRTPVLTQDQQTGWWVLVVSWKVIGLFVGYKILTRWPTRPRFNEVAAFLKRIGRNPPYFEVKEG